MRHRLTVLRLLLLSLSLTACTIAPWREQSPPWGATSVAGADDVRVVTRDGDEVVLSAPEVAASGDVALLRGKVDGVERCVLLADIAQLETRHTEILPVIANVAIAAVVVAGVVVLCACSGGHGGGGCSLSGLEFGSGPSKCDGERERRRERRDPILQSEHPVSGRVR